MLWSLFEVDDFFFVKYISCAFKVAIRHGWNYFVWISIKVKVKLLVKAPFNSYLTLAIINFSLLRVVQLFLHIINLIWKLLSNRITSTVTISISLTLLMACHLSYLTMNTDILLKKKFDKYKFKILGIS